MIHTDSCPVTVLQTIRTLIDTFSQENPTLSQIILTESWDRQKRIQEQGDSIRDLKDDFAGWLARVPEGVASCVQNSLPGRSSLRVVTHVCTCSDKSSLSRPEATLTRRMLNSTLEDVIYLSTAKSSTSKRHGDACSFDYLMGNPDGLEEAARTTRRDMMQGRQGSNNRHLGKIPSTREVIRVLYRQTCLCPASLHDREFFASETERAGRILPHSFGDEED